MFKAIKKWWDGMWAEEASPGPKITKEQIDRVGDVIREMKEGSFDRAKPTGTDAECIALAVHAKGKVAFKEAHTTTVQRGVNDPEPSPIRPLMAPKRGLTVKFTGQSDRVANVDEFGGLLPVGASKARTILPGVEISFITEPGIGAARKDGFDELEETVIDRLGDPKPVRVDIDELVVDTPTPTARRPRRRGKRGGVKRNNRSKKK